MLSNHMVIATSQRLCVKNTPSSPVCHIWRKHYSIYMPAKGLTAEWDLIPNSWEILCAILCLLSPQHPQLHRPELAGPGGLQVHCSHSRWTISDLQWGGGRAGQERIFFFFFLCTIFKVLFFFCFFFFVYFFTASFVWAASGLAALCRIFVCGALALWLCHVGSRAHRLSRCGARA